MEGRGGEPGRRRTQLGGCPGTVERKRREFRKARPEFESGDEFEVESLCVSFCGGGGGVEGDRVALVVSCVGGGCGCRDTLLCCILLCCWELVCW